MSAKRGVRCRFASGRFALVFSLAVLVLALSIINVSISVSAETGKECSVNSNSVKCAGTSIYTKGFGAVELCQVCYQCGISDGVCPESYSDGVFETDTVKTTMQMRVGRGTFYGDIYSVAFKTGNSACAEIGGDCDKVQRSTDNSIWVDEGAGGCTRDVSVNDAYNNAYFRAVCKDVPRKAGCEYCPDPDCKNNLSGFTIDTTTNNPISGVTIRVRSQNNPELEVIPNGLSISGLYQMGAVSGELNITCEKNGYKPYSVKKYVSSGRNIFDCQMVRDIGSCTQQCYVTDANGDAVCKAECDETNGCGMTPEALVQCDGKLLGTKILNNSVMYNDSANGCTYQNITTMTCCSGALSTETLGVYAPGGAGSCFGASCMCISEGSSTMIGANSNVSSIITRNYRKVLDGSLPVTLKIITYNVK